MEAKFRQLKFRNDFILSIGACNAVTQKYFTIDVMDIIEVRMFVFVYVFLIM